MGVDCFNLNLNDFIVSISFTIKTPVLEEGRICNSMQAQYTLLCCKDGFELKELDKQ